jgi:predicted transcriptional regulator
MLRKDGMSDTEIARGFGISLSELRAANSIASAEQRQTKILTAQKLADKGMSNSEIGRRMGINESSVRSLLAPGALDKATANLRTADMLKSQFAEGKKYLDVGAGVSNQLGITETRLKNSIAILQEQGYQVHNIYVPQVNQPGKYTTRKVLVKPGVTKSEVDRNRQDIELITSYSEDHGRSYLKTQPPLNVSSRRLDVKYAEDGGGKLDGVIYVRPGVKDLQMGSDHYGQVRIMIDNTHFLKGMAIYKDDLPAGKDLIFHTNKSNTGRKKDALKELTTDPDLPFGSIIRQVHGPDGKVISAMNIVGSPTKPESGVEGGWDTWSKTLASQFLAKQSPKFAKSQLAVTYEDRVKEFGEIKKLTEPTVRKKLLESFADETDSASVHLAAAAIPGQATKVILPITSMKPGEVHAPNLADGTRVALVRYPHGGTFEIPQLIVNNRNPEARKLLGTSTRDAIGIHHSVAERLSGADFDGDTVVLIPNNKGTVRSTPALEGLKGFDPHHSYPPYDGMRTIDGGIYNAKTRKVDYHGQNPISSRKQNEMGRVSNLITDMTVHGAKADELARAVRHSMVVIDSEKHSLDFKASERDNGIKELVERYQQKPGKRAGGASTLLSRAGAREDIPQRVLRKPAQGGPIDPVTGKKVYIETGRMKPERKQRINPVTGKKEYYETGKMIPIMETHERLAVTEDAMKLLSGTHGTPIEVIYAEHSNRLKALANEARKETVGIKPTKKSPSAAAAYKNEVASINAKVNLAEKNAPLERQAQSIANTTVSQKRQAHPGMDPADVKKIRQQALTEARARTGAGKDVIRLTQSEWDAIQAGAISHNQLEKVIKHSDLETVKKLATPKVQPKMSSAKTVRAKQMLDSGYTQAEVANALGVGLTTLKTAISEM